MIPDSRNGSDSDSSDVIPILGTRLVRQTSSVVSRSKGLSYTEKPGGGVPSRVEYH